MENTISDFYVDFLRFKETLNTFDVFEFYLTLCLNELGATNFILLGFLRAP